jgi:T5SS/PEP-CTERM-associated repeat protein/autotransporter-associated beta strand protein
LNRIYRLVFNPALATVQVASELATGGRVPRTGTRRAPQLALLGTAIALVTAWPAAAGVNGWNEWRGTIDQNWNNAGNWEFGKPTGGSVAAYIDSGRQVEVTTVGEQTNHIHLGYENLGILSILGGGTLTSATIFMGTGDPPGSAATAEGRATISGAGSTWTSLTTIGVGHWGRGTVDIDNGGRLAIGSDAYIASGNTAVGLVNVDGAGSTFTTAATLRLGHNGNGTVKVTDGGQMQSAIGLVGENAGSVGLAEISGVGSTWTNTSTLTIGQSGTGTVRVLDAGYVEARSALILGSQGVAPGNRSSGSLLVSGVGSRLFQTLGTATIGGAGLGAVEVRDGGSIRVQATDIGVGASGSGSVLVTGAGTSWDSGAIRLGVNGDGRFEVRDGGTATLRGNLALGENASGTGTFVVGPNGTLVMAAATATINRGAGNGNQTFELAGGTLRADHWLNLNTAVTVSADSTLDVGGNLVASLPFAGAGQVTKTGAGTLMLGGDSRSWSGGLQIDGGTLSLVDGAALGAGALGMADGTTLHLFDGVVVNSPMKLQGEIGVSVASGDATLYGGIADATGSAVLAKQDAGTLILSNGAYAGKTRIDGGTVRAIGNAMPTGNIDIGELGTFETDTTRVVTYAGQFSGAGTLRQGRHYLGLLGDSSGFTGTTLVMGGQLDLAGKLGGVTQLENGAWLTGNGTVGTVRLLSSSVLSPGSTREGPIGRLAVDGDLSFDASTSFQVDVADNGRSDHVDVLGQAVLGQANTVAVAATGDWKPSTRYTVLSARKGVDGRFSGVTSNFAFLDPTLDYDANNVYLTMARNDIAFEEVGLAFPAVEVNPNQLAVAKAVEALGSGNEVYEAVVRLEVPQVAPAFDHLSGQLHAANRTALLQDRFLHEGIDQRLDGAVGITQVGKASAWFTGSGGNGNVDGDGNGVGLRSSREGAMAGVDWRLGEHALLGLAAGSQRVDNQLDGYDARSQADAIEYGVYGQARWGRLSLRAGVSRADYEVDSQRQVVVGSTLNQHLVSRQEAQATSIHARLGWDLPIGSLTLTPELELSHVRLESDAAREHGGSAALDLAASKDEYMTATAALAGRWDISQGASDRALLTARLGWQVADGDLRTDSHARFGTGPAFTIAGAPLARDMGLAQVGVSVSPTASSRLSLQAQLRAGDGQRDTGALMTWQWMF